MTNRLGTCVLSLAVAIGGLSGVERSSLAAWSSSAAIDSEQLTFRNGRTWRGEIGDRVEVQFQEGGVAQTLQGVLKGIEKRFIQVEGTIAGKTAVKTILLGDVTGMTTISGDSAAPSGTPPASTSTSPTTAPSGGTATTKDGGANRSAASSDWPGVFLLPLSGTLGIGLRHDEIEKIGEEADKYGPGQIIVLWIDSPGGLVIEGDKVGATLNDLKKRHRVVAWIKEAISGGAFTALHCDENYYMSVGALGAITMFAGTTAASGPQLQAWLERCGEVAESGGRNRYVVQAMIHAPLECSYDVDPETGKITYYNTMEGEFDLSDATNNLTLNASNALHSGYSQGTADSVEELAKLMQLPEWKEAASGVGRKIHDEWQRTVKEAQTELPKLVQRLNYKGSGTGDASVVLGTQIQILQEILRWYDRCYPVCVYEVGLPQDPEPLRRQLAEMRRQLAQMRRGG